MLIKCLLNNSPLLISEDTSKNKIQAPTLKKLIVSLVEKTDRKFEHNTASAMLAVCTWDMGHKSTHQVGHETSHKLGASQCRIFILD